MQRFSIIAVSLVVLLILFTADGNAQFRSQDQGSPRAASSMIQGGQGSSFFGFFNPENFHMSHTFSMSYMGSAMGGMSVGMYTNSMFYRISSPLDVRVDVSMMHTPYNSFNAGMENRSDVFISRAELNYRPSENFRVQVQFNQIPYGAYGYGYGYGYGSSFYNPWYNRYGF